MPGLPATGTLEYNGVQFVGAHHLDVEVTPIYDDAGVRVKFHRIVLSVEFVVTAADAGATSTDQTMAQVRSQLMQSRGTLIFKNKGFGDDLVIRGGDYDNGPKPEILNWDPIGDVRAANVSWRVTVTIPPCRYPIQRGITSINWGITWAIDQQGDTTRTLTGFIEIRSEYTIASADQFREYFAPAAVEGFRRTQTWNLIPATNRINFTIVDAQIPSPNPYPIKTTMIECRHRTSWRPGKDAKKIFNTFSCRVAMEDGTSPSEAWVIFLTLANQRIAWSDQQDVAPFLMGLEIEEDLFARSQSFVVQYRILSSITDLVKSTGLWRAIGTNWNEWAVSLSGSMFNDRGNRGMLDVPGDHAIVDLCAGQQVIRPNNNIQKRFVNPGETRQRPVRNRTPKSEKSWLHFNSSVVPVRDRPAVRQSFLQSPDDPTPGSYEAQTGRAPSRQATYSPDGSQALSDTIQVGGRSRYGAVLVGSAMRAGHKIPVPRLDRVGTQPAVEQYNVFLQEDMGDFFGVPVFRARWNIGYLIEGPPGRILFPLEQSELA